MNIHRGTPNNWDLRKKKNTLKFNETSNDDLLTTTKLNNLTLIAKNLNLDYLSQKYNNTRTSAQTQ